MLVKKLSCRCKAHTPIPAEWGCNNNNRWPEMSFFSFLWEGCHGNPTRGHTNKTDGWKCPHVLYPRRVIANFDISVWVISVCACAENSPSISERPLGTSVVRCIAHNTWKMPSYSMEHAVTASEEDKTRCFHLLMYLFVKTNKKNVFTYFLSWEHFSQTLGQWKMHRSQFSQYECSYSVIKSSRPQYISLGKHQQEQQPLFY